MPANHLRWPCTLRRGLPRGVASVFALFVATATAHPGHEHDTFSGIWPAHRPTDLSAGQATQVDSSSLAESEFLAAATAPTSTDVRLSSWKLATGATGTSTSPAVNAVVSQIKADVNTVAHNSNYVYIRTSGIPSHAVGPNTGNPSTPGDVNATYRVARNPLEQTATKTRSVTTLGPIGVMVNGAAIYSPSDGTYWRPTTGTLTNPGEGRPAGSNWSTNALWRRAAGMDSAGGHPSPVANQTNSDGSAKGFYHYHRSPIGLINQIDPGNTGSKGSPIVGYAFDGFAIVGPYAYAPQNDGSLLVVQMTSSYTVGPTSIRGTNGPSLTTYALGSFIEDFVYLAGSGNLNQYNMAFVIFDSEGRAVLTDNSNPAGEWAYFVTNDVLAGSSNDITLDGAVAWPYVVGPDFFGVVDSQSIGGGGVTFTVPNDVTYYFEQLTGDYNADGVVNAADYTVWRDCLGADYGVLANDPTGLPIGEAQYNLWVQNFGATVGDASTPADLLNATVVPEPAANLVGLGGLLALVLGRRTLTRSTRGEIRWRFRSVALMLVVFSSEQLSLAAGPPNIIHIIADDFGWTNLSSNLTNNGTGSRFYQTPHIDQLASQGMSFTSAYATQTCSPTRAALMTGQYAPRTGVYNVQSLNVNNAGSLLVGASNSTTINTSSQTIAETLKTVGYTTAHFGKFHVTQRESDITTAHGFDFDYGGSRSGAPGTYFANNAGQFDSTVGPGLDAFGAPYTQAYINANLKPYANGADVDSLVGTPKHLTDATADAAISFIDNRLAAGGEPFYMNLAFHAVHTPLEPRPDLAAKYAAILASNGGVSPDPRHTSATYAGLTEGLDQSIGRLVSYLGDPNGDGNAIDSIIGNTYLVFSGDNGGLTQSTSNSPLRDGKGTQYEGGLRTPLVVWAPGRVTAGSSSDIPVHIVDFYPTFAELGGAPLPSSVGQPLDGISLASQLADSTTTLDRDAVYFHFPGYQALAAPTSTVVQSAGDHRNKLMYFYEDRSYEFYDLNNDLGESNNLADGELTPNEYKLATRAAVQLRTWLDETGALYPTVRASGEIVPPPQNLPTIEFNLGADLDGQATATQSQLGITLSLAASGASAHLDATSSGVGVASTLDSGSTEQQQRIHGGLSTPETVTFSFNSEVSLKSLTLEALETDGSESIILRFVSGMNPFTGLEGYTGDGFTLGADYLQFTGSAAGASSFTLPFGILGREEFWLAANTVLSLTANPAANGGILLKGIAVAEPLSQAARVALDYNLDGVISAADFETWRDTFGSTADLRADGNGDGIVDGADYTLWRDFVTGGATAVASSVPEPSAVALFWFAIAMILLRGSLERSANQGVT